MIVLDTDHITELQWGTSPPAKRLTERLRTAGEPVATTIITVEEQMRGWLARIRRQKAPGKQIATYERLQEFIQYFARWIVLPWDEAAVDVFEELRKQRIRIGTMDLKIASIVRAHEATLLSRNVADFERVPALRVENWLT